MTSTPLTLLEIEGNDSKSIGHQHGEVYRRQIYEISEIRLQRICGNPPHPKMREVLRLAEDHLPLLEKFDQHLFNELQAISDSSNVSLGHLVVLNHYTDLRDMLAKNKTLVNEASDNNGGCSIIFSPTTLGNVIGQTWDIHASAEPYVIALKLKDAIFFSITGCLGMIGINQYGVAIGINNLRSNDAQLGIVWPAVIRKALTHTNAVKAQIEILDAPLGSGRHFAVADDEHFFSIECSGTKKKVVYQENDQLYFHTNHCLDEEMQKTQIIPKDSTTFSRLQKCNEEIRYQDLSSAENVFLALANVSLKADPIDPHKTATAGSVTLDIKKRQMLGCRGISSSALLSCPTTRISL